jgi:methyl-accepting chemotaxis protein
MPDSTEYVQNSLDDIKNETKEIKAETKEIGTTLKHEVELVKESFASLRREWSIFMALLTVVGAVLLALIGAVYSNTSNNGNNLTELTGRMGRVEGTLSSIEPTAAALAQTDADLRQVADSLKEASQPVVALDEHMKEMIGGIETASQQLSGQIRSLSDLLKNQLPETTTPPAPSENGSPSKQ